MHVPEKVKKRNNVEGNSSIGRHLKRLSRVLFGLGHFSDVIII
jgi:hypothetical protein